MSVALLAPWVWGMGRAVARGELAMAFAGALAVSTYVQGTSFDYNLITTYPLLLLLFLEARRTDRWGLLVFGLFAIIGDRRLFMTPGATILTPNFHFVAGAGLPGRRGALDRARPRGPPGGARAGLAQRTTNQRTAIACRCSTVWRAARSRT